MSRMSTFDRVGEAGWEEAGNIDGGRGGCGGGLGGSGLIVTGGEGRSTDAIVEGVEVVGTAEGGQETEGIETDRQTWFGDGSSRVLVAGEADTATLLDCH